MLGFDIAARSAPVQQGYARLAPKFLFILGSGYFDIMGAWKKTENRFYPALKVAEDT